MTSKRLKLSVDQLQPIATGLGACRASDKIVVDGELVGFMVREPPLDAADSGWRFFSGSESLDYMNDASKHGVYDLNLVANCDPAVVEHLGAAVGLAFERAGDCFIETPAELP
jgi:hypothetical protein